MSVETDPVFGKLLHRLERLRVSQGEPSQREALARNLRTRGVTVPQFDQVVEGIRSGKRWKSETSFAKEVARIMASPMAFGDFLHTAPKVIEVKSANKRTHHVEIGEVFNQRRLAWALTRVEKKPIRHAARELGVSEQKAAALLNEHIAQLNEAGQKVEPFTRAEDDELCLRWQDIYQERRAKERRIALAEEKKRDE